MNLSRTLFEYGPDQENVMSPFFRNKSLDPGISMVRNNRWNPKLPSISVPSHPTFFFLADAITSLLEVVAYRYYEVR